MAGASSKAEVCTRALLSYDPRMAAFSTLLCALSVLTTAQTLPTLPPPPAPASSLKTLGAQLAAALRNPPMPAKTALAIATTVKVASARANLDALVSDTLEAELRATGLVFSKASRDDATERIELDLALVEGHLLATARRRALPTTLWEALADPTGRVLATATANLPIDLELRTLLGLPLREVRLDLLRVIPVGPRSAASLGRAPILDCAVADLDMDRLPELIVLEPTTVRALGWRAGGFPDERASTPLAPPAAAARLRDPLGRLVPLTRADGTWVLVAASSDRAEPTLLALGPAGFTPLSLPLQRGWPLYATGVDSLLIAPWPEALDTLEGGLAIARLGTSSATWVGPASKVHAVTGPAPGTTLAALAGGGLLRDTTRIPEAGLAHAVLDLDADGAAELLTTSLALTGPDRLTLRALDRPARVLWSGQAAAPVTALCGGDVDRDGYVEFIAATWDGTRADLLVIVPAAGRS